jgi:SHS2 domain-containing protein
VARGATIEQAFMEAALAVFAAAAGPADVQAREVREIRAHGPTLQRLLVHWIGECFYVYEVEGFVGRAVEFAVFDAGTGAGGEPMRLHAFLRGAILPETAAGAGVIRAISAVDDAIRRHADGYEIRLVVET